MKTIFTVTSLFLLIGLTQTGQAQSTTGGRSEGSTASTDTGYLTGDKRPAETSAASMTIADEGASRAYMYVPQRTPKIGQPHPTDQVGQRQVGRKHRTRQKQPATVHQTEPCLRRIKVNSPSGITAQPARSMVFYRYFDQICYP